MTKPPQQRRLPLANAAALVPSPPQQQRKKPRLLVKENTKEVIVANATNTGKAISTRPLPQRQQKENGTKGAVTNSTQKNNFVFPIPSAPPMMRYTSSAAFSDITLPYPNLSSSRSFGPSGVLSGHYLSQQQQQPPPPFAVQQTDGNSLNAGNQLIGRSLLASPMPNDPLHHLDQLGNSHPERDDCSNGDLSFVASALLDLAPAVEEKRPDGAARNINKHLRGKRLTKTNSNYYTNRNCAQASSVETAPIVYHRNPQVARRAQRLLENVPLTMLACKCKNTKCLKLYCACFQTGSFCDELICSCKGCNNTQEHSTPRGTRVRAIYEILNRRIEAFEPRLKKKTGMGCSCKKSRCLQKYCDCFANGGACTSKCSCVECANYAGGDLKQASAADDVSTAASSSASEEESCK